MNVIRPGHRGVNPCPRKKSIYIVPKSEPSILMNVAPPDSTARLKALSPQVSVQVPLRFRACGRSRSWSGGAGRGRSQGLDRSTSLFGSCDDESGLGRGSVILVDLEGSDTPIRITESPGVILDESLTAAGLRRTSRVLAPDVPGPVTTESVVEGESLVLEEAKVAIALEGGGGNAPAGRVGVTILNIPGFGAVAPKPDFDELIGEFGRVSSTTVVVELRAVGISAVG